MMVTEVPGLAGSPVVELRQYALKPGATDALVEVFEMQFVESQEALGMRVGGLFRDRDDADRFIWMRGFAGMPERCEALAAFYGGPVWKRHGPAANATMVDSDDVLLLRPTVPVRPPLAPPPRPPVGAAASSDELVAVTAYLHRPAAGTCEWLAANAHPVLEKALGSRVAMWRTEPAENTFPALPVRSDHVVVWTATFADEAAYDAALARLEDTAAWRALAPELARRVGSTETLRLRPTARSEHPPTMWG
jgi:hypothetical protein